MIHNHTGNVLTERGLRLAQSALQQLRETPGAKSAQVTLEFQRGGGKPFSAVATLQPNGMLT